jgi:hypothetical protein
MSLPSNVGRVESLFLQISKDWWRFVYNEPYLYTDGDCVEDPIITQMEYDGLWVFLE